MTKQKGIPYDIIGSSGIMVAKAEDVRRVAKDQFDKCNEWFNKQIVHCVDESEIHRIAATKENNMNNQKQYAIEVLEQVIKICEDYSDDKYSCYKNYRTDDLIYTEGLSDGAERCARMIEDLLEKIKNEQVD